MFSSATIMGTLVNDPQPKGRDCAFTVQVNNTKQSHSDNDDSFYIDVEATGPKADFVMKFFTKGKPIVLDGTLKQNGVGKLMLMARNVEFMGGPAKQESKPVKHDFGGESFSAQIPF